MNCYVHNDREAIGTCVGCGKFICEECCTEVNGKNYCKKCVSELINERERKIERLEDKNQPMVFMNAGGGGAAASSSSSSSGGYGHPAMIPIKSKTTAGILAILLGGLGAHKFYLGKPLQGLLYLIFIWTCIPAILGLIEGIIYLTKSDYEFAQKYGGRAI